MGENPRSALPVKINSRISYIFSGDFTDSALGGFSPVLIKFDHRMFFGGNWCNTFN
jgi:hypothetical protein